MLITVATLGLWSFDLGLPLGNSDDGRLVAFSGLHARNFTELGPVESRLGARVDPFVRPEFGVEPRTEAPLPATTYAHHPPLKEFLSIAAASAFGNSPAALRIPIFLLGAVTLLFMASLLRGCGLSWPPTLLSIGVLACTGFFYVYGRLGVSFGLLVASAATVAWARGKRQPSRLVLVGLATAAAGAAMQSWIAIAALGPLALWLWASQVKGARQPDEGRRTLRDWLAALRSPALLAFVIGTAAGLAVTFSWMLYATGFDELRDQVAIRTSNRVSSSGGTASFGFGEFLARQWRFATEELLVPPWLRVLAGPAIAAALLDRRTRVAGAITLGVAAALTFGIPQGAWIHRLWNFPWLMPVTIGTAVLADWAARLLRRNWQRIAAFSAAAGLIVATVVAVATGSTRDRYLTDPARVGEALERAAVTPEASRAELAWTGPGLPAPRWASWYLDVPVWGLDEQQAADVAPTDIIILRINRVPEWIDGNALAEPLAAAGDFVVISGQAIAADRHSRP